MKRRPPDLCYPPHESVERDDSWQRRLSAQGFLVPDAHDPRAFQDSPPVDGGLLPRVGGQPTDPNPPLLLKPYSRKSIITENGRVCPYWFW